MHASPGLKPQLFELAELTLLRGAAPLGEVDLPTAVVDVGGEPPGNWGDIGVPGVDGLVRVAVVAGALEDALDVRGYDGGRDERLSGVDRRIDVRWPEELPDDQENDDDDERDLQPFLHDHRTVQDRLRAGPCTNRDYSMTSP